MASPHTAGEVDEFMSVLDGVDWGELADEEIRDYRLAAEAWLRSDDRFPDELDRDDPLGVVLDVGASASTVAGYADAWLMNEINHQGSLSPTATPVCRLWVKVADESPDQQLRVEAMTSLGWVLTCASHSWPPFGFELEREAHQATYEEIDKGWPVYRRAMDPGSGSAPEIRMICAIMAPWLSDRRDVSAAILRALASSEIPFATASGLDELEPLSFVELLFQRSLGRGDLAEARITCQLLRALGATALGTDLEDQAESVLRSYVDAPEQLSDHARIGLARLRRLRAEDQEIVTRRQARLGDLRANPNSDGRTHEVQVTVDALVLHLLHCQPTWDDGPNPQEEAELLIAESLDEWLAPRARFRHGLPQLADDHVLSTDEPASPMEVALLELVERGRATGQLSLDDVFELFPGVDMTPENLEHLHHYFKEKGFAFTDALPDE